MALTTRAAFILGLTLMCSCAGFRHPKAPAPMNGDTTMNDHLVAQSRYCTELHDELNETTMLDTLWWGSLIGGVVGTSAAALLSAGVGASAFGYVTNQPVVAPEVMGSLAIAQAASTIVASASWITFAFANERRSDVTDAQETMLAIRLAADDLQESSVLGALGEQNLESVRQLAKRCHDVAVDLKTSSESETVSFARSVSKDVTDQTVAAVAKKEREGVALANHVSSADALALKKYSARLRAIDRVEDEGTEPKALDAAAKEAGLSSDVRERIDALVKAGTVKDPEARAELHQIGAAARDALTNDMKAGNASRVTSVAVSEDVCLLGFRRIDENEIVIPAVAEVVLELVVSRPGAEAHTYSLLERKNDVDEIRLGTSADATRQMKIEASEEPRILLIGDLMDPGFRSVTRPLSFPVDASPALGKQRSVPVTGDVDLRFTWSCAVSP